MQYNSGSSAGISDSHTLRVLFVVQLHPSGTLKLVEYGDGGYGILQNDQPFGGYRWNAGKLEQSVSTFLRLRRQNRNPDKPSMN